MTQILLTVNIDQKLQPQQALIKQKSNMNVSAFYNRIFTVEIATSIPERILNVIACTSVAL